jgi:hypothetical protein
LLVILSEALTSSSFLILSEALTSSLVVILSEAPRFSVVILSEARRSEATERERRTPALFPA